jgi:hypothetical protein
MRKIVNPSEHFAALSVPSNISLLTVATDKTPLSSSAHPWKAPSHHWLQTENRISLIPVDSKVVELVKAVFVSYEQRIVIVFGRPGFTLKLATP